MDRLALIKPFEETSGLIGIIPGRDVGSKERKDVLGIIIKGYRSKS